VMRIEDCHSGLYRNWEKVRNYRAGRGAAVLGPTSRMRVKGPEGRR